jgi:hypothetical protein
VKHTPSSPAQSATSLPQAPTDDAGSRFAKYAITMAIRMACFIAMVLITPYGWYTWVLGAGAIFLPYIAVIIANVGADVRRTGVVSPERAIEAPPAPVAAEPLRDAPTVIRITETPRLPAGDDEAR